jgi:hypothetical protein
MIIQKTALSISIILLLSCSSWTFGQASEKEGPSAAEIEKKLSELLNTLPSDEPELEKSKLNSGSESSEGATGGDLPNAELTSEQDDIIAAIEAEMEEISQTKRTKQTKEQRLRLAELRARLKIAKTIRQQLVRTGLTKSKLNRGAKSIEDSFVIATIEVAANSDSADIRFAALDGETGCTNDLYKFVEKTPKGGYRDYRIIGRYLSPELASKATDVARQEYDTMKERERQMIAYIQARERHMARVKASRRC